MIIVNFKRYPQASGENALLLTKICAKLAAELHLTIIPAPEINDLPSCSLICPVWTQKFESQSAIQAGTLLNHSDFRLSRNEIQEELYLSKSRGDKVCLCSADVGEVPDLLTLRPDYLAYEPPELIGSKTTSVAQAEPEVIGKIARLCFEAKIPLLVGAGIKSRQDVEVSLSQGAIGVLVASDIVLAANQEHELRDLAAAFSMKT